MATKFTIFPKFPLEIREMIWAETAVGRVVTIWEHRYDLEEWEWNDSDARKNNPDLPHFSSVSVIPAVFQASRESRRVAKRPYKWFFDEIAWKQPCVNPFYFNPALDTIFIPSFGDYESFMKHTNGRDEMKLIRYLAIRMNVHPGYPVSSAYQYLAEFGRLENLKSLIVHVPYHQLQPLQKFELRKQLRKFWKNDKTDEGDLEKKMVMQNPDIVFLTKEEMKVMELVHN